MFRKLIPQQLHILRDVYSQNLMTNISTQQLLTHFIERFEKYPQWVEKVHFFSPKNSNLTKDGTFVLVNEHQIQFDTLEPPPYTNLIKILSSLDFSERKMFVNVRENYRHIVLDDLTRLLNLEKIYEQGRRLMKCPVEEETFQEFIQE